MAEAAATLGPSSAQPAGTAVDEPGDRGHLQVADRVLQRIATAAAREVDGVALDTASGALGRLVSSGYPSVEVDSAGTRVRAQVDIAVLWPRPAATVAAGVRDAVARRLEELAAVRVDAVTVTVRSLVRPRPRPPGARVR